MVNCMAKRTYLMPDNTASEFETTVPPGERSKVISKLIQDWLDEKRRERTRAAIVEGCREMSEIYRETAAAWNAADEETWRVF